ARSRRRATRTVRVRQLPERAAGRAASLSPDDLGRRATRGGRNRRPAPDINVTLMRGVRASFALQLTHDPRQALVARNPDVAPHLSIMDAGGHGYAVVRAGPDALDVEFVGIPRPVERSEAPDCGPVAYRVTHRVAAWGLGAVP